MKAITTARQIATVQIQIKVLVDSYTIHHGPDKGKMPAAEQRETDALRATIVSLKRGQKAEKLLARAMCCFRKTDYAPNMGKEIEQFLREKDKRVTL